MRHATILRLVLMLILATMLAGGCAKKPTPSEEQAAMRDEAPMTTEMAEEEVSGIEERAISESEVEDAAARDEADMDGLKRIYFGFDQYTLSDEARETLKENAEYLENNPDVEVRMEGHTDRIGSDEYNLALGERRARAAKNYLVSLGIDEGRMSTISYGEEKPLDPAETEEARARNRRVEFKIVY